MKLEELKLLTLGTVTSSGLQVGKSLFTSSMMIKEKWFEQAGSIGNWNIPVILQASNPDVVHLIELIVTDKAFRVQITPRSGIDQHHVEDYHLKLQGLKLQLFEKEQKQ